MSKFLDIIKYPIYMINTKPRYKFSFKKTPQFYF